MHPWGGTSRWGSSSVSESQAAYDKKATNVEPAVIFISLKDGKIPAGLPWKFIVVDNEDVEEEESSDEELSLAALPNGGHPLCAVFHSGAFGSSQRSIWKSNTLPCDIFATLLRPASTILSFSAVNVPYR